MALFKAPVQSVATRTGAVTLSTSDISGLGTAATQSYTEPANYTPTIGDVSNNFTMSVQVGLSTQLANGYYTQIHITWTGKGSATAGNSIRISLPGTLVNTTNYRVSFSIGFVEGITFSAGQQITASATAGNNYIDLYAIKSNASAPTPLAISDCSTAGEIYIGGFFRTA